MHFQENMPRSTFHGIVKNIALIFSCILISSSPTLAKTSFSEGAKYEVCFTPGEDCTGLIINALNKAREQVLVQAYSFTSAPIAKALLDAHRRGVDVKIILDKSQLTARYSIMRYLLNNEVPIWIDTKPAIAHNKVMVIDQTTITGSFNFTAAAQSRNAENALIIDDPELAKQYKTAWVKRLKVSKRIEP